MKKVISIVLFGTGDAYAQYLPAHVLAHHNLYPKAEGWDLWLHTDVRVADERAEFINRAIERGLLKTAVHGEVEGKTKAMLWRMSPLFDGDYADAEYVFCRDLDAPPMPRDRLCMEMFIISKMDVHTVHDNEQHVGVMGGLCGFRTKTFREKTGLNSLADVYKFGEDSEYDLTGRVLDWARHGADQDVLNRFVGARNVSIAAWPKLELLENRYAGWYNGKNAHASHEAGVYRCKARTTKVPDMGWPGYLKASPQLQHGCRLSHAALAAADHIGAHLGCAGYDHEVARAFWEEHGDPEIARLVRECEET